MKYYIDQVNTWKAANSKCREVQSFAVEFRQTLIPDEAAAEALVEEIRQKVEELNGLYPRMKRLVVRRLNNFIYCNFGDKYVFSFHIEEVRRIYTATEEQKGGAQ